MKLHLPLLLLTALVSTLAAHSTRAAEIPADYESIDLWIPDMLEEYTSNDSTGKYAFILWTDMEFTPQTSTSWGASTPLITGGNLLFTSVDGYESMSVKFSDGSSQVFQQPTNITFDTLSHVNISNQTGNSNGAAINLGTSGKLTIRNVDDGMKNLEVADVVFSENKLSAGSALYGAAIYANGTNTTIDVSYNGSISFSDNTISVSSAASCSCQGGAIFSTNQIIFNNNDKISFEKNSCTVKVRNTYTSGAQSHSSTAQGGAIFSNSSLSLSNNTNVSFIGNSSSSDTACSAVTVAWANSSAYGGAIYSTETVAVCNNLNVTFANNSASSYASAGGFQGYSHQNSNSYGGALYSTGSLTITGNDSVIFEKNYEKQQSTYRLRSIYIAPDSDSDSLVLSAKTGGYITFYDSVCMDYYSGATVSFNADYNDANGVSQKATGDIIFSGKYAAEHLAEVKGSAGTSSEITSSQTSTINNHITLYGGSLQVVDGAKLNGLGLTVAADSQATLLLRDGSMSHSSYNFTFNSASTLELQGLNTITASKVTMGSGASLVVTLNEANLTTAALTLGGTDLATSQLAVHLERTDNGLRSGMYKIISQSSSDFTIKSAWTAANVTVTGSGNTSRASFEDLVWENGTLYYKVGRNIWANTSGDGLWNGTSDNWTMNGRSYTYLDGMDVSFTDAAAGTVKLEGDIAAADIIVNNTAGNDYTFAAADGGGRLTGTGGLTKQGSGELTLATANDYTGHTTLEGGTLNVYHSTALGATANGSASVTTATGTTLKVGNNSHLVLAGEHNLAGAVEVAEGSTLEMSRNGYAAENSQVNGTLKLQNATATTSTLSGSGTVQATNSQLSVTSLSGFTGNLALEGKDAAMNISSGNYNGAGTLSVAGGALSFSEGAKITLNAGGLLELKTWDDAVARFTANNINIKKGATLAASTGNSQLGDAPELSSRGVGAELNCSFLTLNMGATLNAEDAYFDLNNGTLTLAVIKSGTEKIQLILAEHTIYTGSEQIILFANAAKVAFIYDGITASGDSSYTLKAADYFSGNGINDDTELVYDSTTGTLYLQGVAAIPEPTTATLSLLALAGLAMRRRRK